MRCSIWADSAFSAVIDSLIIQFVSLGVYGPSLAATLSDDAPGSRLCENAKVLGFQVSLYPSLVTAKPIQRDLEGRFFREPHSARVFTQPRSS